MLSIGFGLSGYKGNFTPSKEWFIEEGINGRTPFILLYRFTGKLTYIHLNQKTTQQKSPNEIVRAFNIMDKRV
jgi:hypothetical protein